MQHAHHFDTNKLLIKQKELYLQSSFPVSKNFQKLLEHSDLKNTFLKGKIIENTDNQNFE